MANHISISIHPLVTIRSFAFPIEAQDRGAYQFVYNSVHMVRRSLQGYSSFSPFSLYHSNGSIICVGERIETACGRWDGEGRSRTRTDGVQARVKVSILIARRLTVSLTLIYVPDESWGCCRCVAYVIRSSNILTNLQNFGVCSSLLTTPQITPTTY